MTFPVNGILDNFNRSNEGPPPSADWANGFFYTGAWWGDSNYKLRVVSNECVAASGSTDGGGAIYTANTYGPDIEVYYEVGGFDSGGANYYLYWSVQDPDSPNDLYSVWFFCPFTYFDPPGEFGYAINITASKAIAGSWTDLILNYGTGVRIDVGDSLGVSHIGDTISFWHKPAAGSWTLLTSVEDTGGSHPAGYLGVEFNRKSSPLASKIDNFGGGTLASGRTADLDVTLDDVTLSADAYLERFVDLAVTLDDVTLVSDAFIQTYYPPILMNTRILVSGGIGVEVSADSALIAHVHEMIAATSIKVSGGATAKIIGNQFDPTAVDVTGTLEYLPGDRSAWDVANYAARHASDIDAATFDYHRNPALSGTYTVSNPVTLRTIDLNNFTLNDLAAIVGTLLADLGLT